MGGTRELLRPIAEQQSETIPYRQPRRAWAGHGTGTLCNLCQQPIEATQIEYEIECQVELESGPTNEVLYMHLDCYHDWAGGADV
ncbi:MAG TPA: hypothetical protein VMG11_12865 [Steroidobacteraceae bacterium]|nr:hypothetical protein [Steroidobacteraceae bacterium]